MNTMTKGERDDLAKLIRQRERLMKTGASQRAAELLADFERQLGTIYSYDHDQTWKAAAVAAKQAVAAAQAEIEKRCQQLGIPEQFAPGISCGWYGRGENAAKDRRAELRRMAITRIAAMEKTARTKIETLSVEAQTELIGGGLTSVAAKEFLEQLPSPKSLMPQLDATEITGLLEKRRS